MKTFLVKKENNAENDDLFGDSVLHSNSSGIIIIMAKLNPRNKIKFPLIVQMKHKTVSEIPRMILDRLESESLNIEDCRGQGYDNAATMAGTPSGVPHTYLDCPNGGCT